MTNSSNPAPGRPVLPRAGARRRRQRLDRRTRAARAEGRDARKALLEAAAKVFARRGFRDASVDEIAAEAGFSKGAVYWHFAGKDDLFFELLEERIDRPFREMIELLGSAPPERDMAPVGSRRFAEVLQEQRELIVLDHEYWSRAVREPELRDRYLERKAELREALAGALAARARHLGTPELPIEPEDLARVFMGLIDGLAVQEIADPGTVPMHLLGDTFALIYAGLVVRAAARSERPTPAPSATADR